MYENLPMYEQSSDLWKGKKCQRNVKTSFSDWKIWPGKLKVEMKYLNTKDYWKHGCFPVNF